MTVHAVHYTVEGNYPFPIDMLRYDASFPRSEIEAVIIQSLCERGITSGELTVNLTHIGDSRRWRPTAARWQSFGWKVVEV